MNSKKILIVNNDKTTCSSLEQELHKIDSKIEILIATTNKEGMKYILENQSSIYVAIIDIDLPAAKENEMVEFSIQMNIATIVLTGISNKTLKEKLLDYDILDYIQKDSKKSINYVIKSTKRIINNYNTNVLIVDDSKLQLKLLKKILESIKLNVLTATNGKDALEIIKNKSNNISLLLTDYIMPEMDGIALTKAVRKYYDNDEMGILVISSNDEMDASTKFFKIGANDYIDKPYMKPTVISRVNAILYNLNLFKKLKSREKKIKSYVDLVDKNVITSSTDLKGNITYVSEAFCEISGYTKEELLGKSHRIVKHKDMPNEIYDVLWETISNDKTWEGEIKNKKKNGDHYWVKASISPIFNEDNKKIGYTAIRQDITDKKLIEEISITDGLTNIYNRRHFDDIFPNVINVAKRSNELVSFLIMDIDHFKQYNDTYGHQMGDEVLIKVSESIKASLHRADDYCFRLGGEEFGIIFKSESKESAVRFANQIRENIENLKIEHSGNSASPYLTASMGLICQNGNEIENKDTAYKKGDDLLYEAKESGINKVCVI